MLSCPNKNPLSPPQEINNDRSLMENVNKQRGNFISLSELRQGPLEFKSSWVRLHSVKVSGYE